MSGAQKPDTTPSKPSSPAKERTGYECAEAAAALLNCVAERSYNEMKCIPLMKKLRACIEKQVALEKLCLLHLPPGLVLRLPLLHMLTCYQFMLIMLRWAAGSC